MSTPIDLSKFTAAPAVAGWADLIAGAEVGNKSGQYFEPGMFLVELVCIKVFERQNQAGGTGFVVEFDVLESDNPAIPVGDRRGWFCDISKKMGASDAKAFMLQVVEAKINRSGGDFNPRAPFDPKILHWAAGEDQPCAGEKFHLKAWHKETRAGGQFTIHDWRPATA